MSSKSGVLYIGAINHLKRGVFEHKQGLRLADRISQTGLPLHSHPRN
jgi:hypothetical protein